MRKIRYAVVGLGWIAQDVILPAFNNAQNSELTALVSDDPKKLEELGKKYKVKHLYSYKDYSTCLRSGHIDAVYIALPNGMHREYVIRAAKEQIHVLCEKAMGMTEQECIQMNDVASKNKIKMMIAYRLHFEEGNLKANHIAQSGKIGDMRLFNSIFTANVLPGNVRWDKELSGGTLYDMGIYSINAVRSVFRQEPIEVSAFTIKGATKKNKEIEESINAILRFPKDRIATITCSFGATSMSTFEVIGTKGFLRVEPAFHHKDKVKHMLKIGMKETKTIFPLRDQFAPEIIYFSDCILKNKNPEPSGREGQADVRVIEAIYRSAKEGRVVKLPPFVKTARPHLGQSIWRKAPKKPKMVNAKGPSKK